MRKWFFIGTLMTLFTTILFSSLNKKGSIWKLIFTFLQLANIASNNGPGRR